MKKIVALVAAAVLAVSVIALSACGKSTDDNKLIVGFDAEYPPYGFIDTTGEFGTPGSYVGFDLDLAAKVCEATGWEFEAVPIDWDAKDALLESGQITCIWNGFTYEGREDGYQWSARYMLNAQVVVVKAGSGITSLADLKGKTVMTQADSAGYDVITSDEYAAVNATFAGGGVKTIGDYNSAFMQLEVGACDAVICDLSIFAFQDAAKPGVYSNIETLSSEHYAVGFAKGNKAAKQMIEVINFTMGLLDESGDIEALCQKYAAYGADYANWCL